MIRIKVKLHHEDSGSCKQIYEQVGEDTKSKYYARTKDGIWCYVADAPDGYCEIDSDVSNDYVFDIVDDSGNIVVSEDNQTPKKFEFIETTCEKEWEKISSLHPNVSDVGRSDYFLQFMDLEKYTDYKNSMSGSVWEINWTDRRSKTIDKRIIHEFNYLGTPYAIYQCLEAHTVCGVMWCEYLIGVKDADYYSYYAGWEAFPTVHGIITIQELEKYTLEEIFEMLKAKQKPAIISEPVMEQEAVAPAVSIEEWMEFIQN